MVMLADYELREIACRHAAVEAAMKGPAADYYSFPFTPHKWVVEAMREVEQKAREDAIDGAYAFNLLGDEGV